MKQHINAIYVWKGTVTVQSGVWLSDGEPDAEACREVLRCGHGMTYRSLTYRSLTLHSKPLLNQGGVRVSRPDNAHPDA